MEADQASCGSPTRAAPRAGAIPLHAAHVAPKRLHRIHTARCLRALLLSLPLAYRFSPDGAGDTFRSVPVPARWPATNINSLFFFYTKKKNISKLPIAKTLRNLRNLAKRKTYLRKLAKISFAKACENLYLRNLANLAKQM